VPDSHFRAHWWTLTPRHWSSCACRRMRESRLRSQSKGWRARAYCPAGELHSAR